MGTDAARSSAGTWAFFVIYVASLAWMYVASTPEVTGNFSEREERGFRVAAVKASGASGQREYVGYTLARLRQPGVDLSQVSFLLPEKVVNIPGGDLHRATVLEDHSSWQLIEYDFGNTHSSLSRYRALKERVEPISYRVTFHPGIMIWAVILLVPALVVAAAMNWIWKAIARKRETAS